jgi:hypothetical protein
MSAAAQFTGLSWIVLVIPFAADAHVDRITGQNYDGYERNDGKGSCCGWYDCRPALAPFTEGDGEKIMDRNRNKYPFDPAIVVQRPSDDGNWHVCGGSGTPLKCIIAPAQAEREPGLFDSLFGWLAPKHPANESLIPTAAEIDRELATAPICRAPGLQALPMSRE